MIFERTRMLLGEEAMRRLKNAHVAVFGIGGVGSYTAEALVRSGVGTLSLIDDDTVAQSNLNRQLSARDSTLGMPKVSAMKQRALDIHPEAVIWAHCLHYSVETAERLDFSQYDYIADCIDTVSAKIDLIVRAKKLGIPIISSMGAGNKLHPELFELTDLYKTSVCPLARVMRRELKARGIQSLDVVYSKEPAITPAASALKEDALHSKRQTPGSVAFVPSAAGMIMAGKIIRELSGWQ